MRQEARRVKGLSEGTKLGVAVAVGSGKDMYSHVRQSSKTQNRSRWCSKKHNYFCLRFKQSAILDGVYTDVAI